MALVPGEIVRLFRQHFGGAAPQIYRAPGRVNLIGEHTDYNLGFVFPIALEMACYAAIAPAAHDKLQVFSREANAGFAININEVAEAKPMHNWSDYVVGVARELARDAVPLKGADIYIASEVPAGSGLSSSAAIEVAIAMALLDGRELQPLEIAKLCQRAEGQFVGMPCGIMDQYAAVFGQKNAAIQIDCRSLTHNYVELPPNLRIIAVNSMVKHELGTSAYRERVAECRAAVEAIQQRYPEVQSLRDVTPEMFVEVEAQIPEIPRKRARHVITDSQRVLALGKAAEAGDLAEMGQLFVDSHRSMQHDYEITCAEIDFLVERALRIPAVYGARMTGGGFGGCTVNLLAPEVEERFRRELAADYKQKFNLDPIFYDCVPSPGASRM
ncbi:MAG TPA: galactokinase [Bryobacteraceae bacterium]|nr:galactokinase [Bryobacteraceae bacterium]